MGNDRAIRIEADGVRVYAVLAATPTAEAVWEALPLEGKAQRHGEEIRFTVPLNLALEKEVRSRLSAGDIAFSPSGPVIALCFGGSTAAAPDPGAASPSPLNIFGRITGDASRLGRVRDGGKIRLTRLEG